MSIDSPEAQRLFWWSLFVDFSIFAWFPLTFSMVYGWDFIITNSLFGVYLFMMFLIRAPLFFLAKFMFQAFPWSLSPTGTLIRLIIYLHFLVSLFLFAWFAVKLSHSPPQFFVQISVRVHMFILRIKGPSKRYKSDSSAQRINSFSIASSRNRVVPLPLPRFSNAQSMKQDTSVPTQSLTLVDPVNSSDGEHNDPALLSNAVSAFVSSVLANPPNDQDGEVTQDVGLKNSNENLDLDPTKSIYPSKDVVKRFSIDTSLVPSTKHIPPNDQGQGASIMKSHEVNRSAWSSNRDLYHTIPIKDTLHGQETDKRCSNIAADVQPISRNDTDLHNHDKLRSRTPPSNVEALACLQQVVDTENDHQSSNKQPTLCPPTKDEKLIPLKEGEFAQSLPQREMQMMTKNSKQPKAEPAHSSATKDGDSFRSKPRKPRSSTNNVYSRRASIFSKSGNSRRVSQFMKAPLNKLLAHAKPNLHLKSDNIVLHRVRKSASDTQLYQPKTKYELNTQSVGRFGNTFLTQYPHQRASLKIRCSRVQFTQLQSNLPSHGNPTGSTKTSTSVHVDTSLDVNNARSGRISHDSKPYIRSPRSQVLASRRRSYVGVVRSMSLSQKEIPSCCQQFREGLLLCLPLFVTGVVSSAATLMLDSWNELNDSFRLLVVSLFAPLCLWAVMVITRVAVSQIILAHPKTVWLCLVPLVLLNSVLLRVLVAGIVDVRGQAFIALWFAFVEIIERLSTKFRHSVAYRLIFCQAPSWDFFHPSSPRVRLLADNLLLSTILEITGILTANGLLLIVSSGELFTRRLVESVLLQLFFEIVSAMFVIWLSNKMLGINLNDVWKAKKAKYLYGVAVVWIIGLMYASSLLLGATEFNYLKLKQSGSW